MKQFIDHLNTQKLSFESTIQWVDHEFCPNIWKNYNSLTSVSDKEKTEMFKTLADFCSSARKCGYEFMKDETGEDILQFLSSEYNSIGTVYNLNVSKTKMRSVHGPKTNPLLFSPNSDNGSHGI